MSQIVPHIKWLSKTTQSLSTKNGIPIEVWELKHLPDDEVLGKWANHFRKQYCLDQEIDKLRDGTGLSRADYLKELVFPDSSQAPGPSIRSGDFTEILIADLMEFIWGYEVPRFRYDNKATRNESTKGVDILGFKMDGLEASPNDKLMVCEAKAALTVNKTANKLQEAINDSAEGVVKLKKAVSLNALKRRLLEKNDSRAGRVQRFQNPINNPYSEISGAAAVFSNANFNIAVLTETDASLHPNSGELTLLVLKGEDLMTLVHSLYERAANEA